MALSSYTPDKIILLGQGKGASIAIDLLANKKIKADGLIMVNMKDDKTDIAIENIDIPILEIYGGPSFVQKPEGVQKRKAIMRRAKRMQYTTRHIVTSHYDYRDVDEKLLSRVTSWLKKQYINMAAE